MAARLHVVTGKGGTGKTTVATSLALALAAQGRQVLLVETEERQGIAHALGCPPLGTSERVVANGAKGGVVYGLSVEAAAALAEYLGQVARLGPASALLEKAGAVDVATSIAPGLRDVLIVGKVYEATRRTASHHRSSGGAPEYDDVVLDAPPTGRIGRFLTANEQMADLAKVGPVHAQAQSVAALLRAGTTAIHVVTLLEEMPVRETVEGVAELRAAGLPVHSIVLNRRRAEIETDADLHALMALSDGSVARADIERSLHDAGVDLPERGLDELLGLASDHLARLTLEDDLAEELAPLGLPLVSLPEVEGDPVTGRLERPTLTGLGAALLDDLAGTAGATIAGSSATPPDETGGGTTEGVAR